MTPHQKIQQILLQHKKRLSDMGATPDPAFVGQLEKTLEMMREGEKRSDDLQKQVAEQMEAMKPLKENPFGEVLRDLPLLRIR